MFNVTQTPLYSYYTIDQPLEIRVFLFPNKWLAKVFNIKYFKKQKHTLQNLLF